MFKQRAVIQERPDRLNSRHVLDSFTVDSEVEVERTELSPVSADLHELAGEKGNGDSLEMEGEMLEIGLADVWTQDLDDSGTFCYHRKRHVGVVG